MVTGFETCPPRGISIALLTPITATGSLDMPALDRLVHRAIDAGIAGLSPVGSTGEGVRLSREQRWQVVKRVAMASQGLPVIAGIPCHAIDDTIVELAAFADTGATAALVTPPGFYPLSDAETVRLFETLADRSPIPLVLYHIPGMARVGFSPGVVARLAPHPAIVGLKDSSRDLEYLHAVVRATAGFPFSVVTGTDALLSESLAAGAVGAIAASPNVAPGLAVDLFNACTADDWRGIRELQGRVLDLVTAARRYGFPAGWKAAAALAGACGPAMVPPALSLPAESRNELSGVLKALGLVTGQEDHDEL